MLIKFLGLFFLFTQLSWAQKIYKSEIPVSDFEILERLKELEPDSLIRFADTISFKKAKSQALLWLEKGSAFHKKAQYQNAVNCYLELIQIGDDLQDNYFLGKGYLRMADAYKRLGTIDNIQEVREKALKSAQRSLRYFESDDLIEGEIEAYNVIGIILRDLKRPEEAKNAFLIGLSLAKENEIDVSYVGVLHANLGQYMIDIEKQYDQAIEQLGLALKVYERLGVESSKEHIYRNLAMAYAGKKDVPLARKYSQMSIDKGKELQNPHRLINGYYVSWIIHKEFGMFKEAFYSLKRQKFLEDSLNSAVVVKEIDDINTKYQTARKDEQMAVLNLENNTKKNQLVILLLGLVIAAVSALLFYGQNQKIKKSQGIIERQSEELKLMMKELHHRVKNNLSLVSSLLNIQLERLEDGKPKAAILQSRQRVDAMAMIHQRLYQTDKLATINIKEYITNLAESLMVAYGYGVDDFILNIRVEDQEIDVDTAIPLGLIINELLTNSFKYAYRGVSQPTLDISFKGKGDI